MKKKAKRRPPFNPVRAHNAKMQALNLRDEKIRALKSHALQNDLGRVNGMINNMPRPHHVVVTVANINPDRVAAACQHIIPLK